MIGACPWVIPASWHTPIIDTRERLHPKRLLTPEELLDKDLEIRQAYHEIVAALPTPRFPFCDPAARSGFVAGVIGKEVGSGKKWAWTDPFAPSQADRLQHRPGVA